MEWLAKEFTLAIKQHEIHPPGICPNRDDAFAVLFCRQSEAVLDFRPKAQDIPTQSVGEVDGTIREPVNFLEGNAFAIPKPGDDAAAFGAEINREIDALTHRFKYARKLLIGVHQHRLAEIRGCKHQSRLARTVRS